MNKEYTADLTINLGELPFDCTVRYTVTPRREQTYYQPAEAPDVDVLAISVDIGCGHVEPPIAIYDMLAEAVSDEDLLAHANEQEAYRIDDAADHKRQLSRENAL
jgi:hypothetical protein